MQKWSADVIVFGTPIYWYGPTAKMKVLLGRMRPFVENKKLRGKRAVVVVLSAEGPKACDPTIEMFRLSFEYLGVEFAGKVLANAFDKGAVSKHPKKLKEAFLLGCSL